MKKLILVILFSLIFLFVPALSFAEVIHSFDSSIVAHKNGLMDVTETINYDFESIDKHGIYRYIPLFSKVGNLYRIVNLRNVKVLRDSNPEPYSITQTDEQISIKIGNANKTITGDHIYKINYIVENGIGSNFADHDEIYWNTTGNGWEVDIEKASQTLTTDFGVKPTNFICFTGSVGSKDKNCSINSGSSMTSGPLYFGEGLSVVAVYPVNTFPKSILSTTPPQTFSEKLFNLVWKNYLYIFIFINFGVGGYLLYWYQKHKNKERFGQPAVNFDIPKDELGNIIRPAVAGTIDTAKLEKDDVTATIFDLAIRKYIKIEQTKTVRNLLPDSTEQTITKLKDTDSSFEVFEKTLMDRLFEDGDSVRINDLKLDFYSTFEDMEADIFTTLINKGYYTKNPAGQKTVLFMLSIFSLFTLNIILAGVLFFLSRKSNGRTQLGYEIDFKIDGLKLFLKSMDRNYKWQAKNFITIEQMIPYAMALGFIDKFMEALKIIKPDYNPSWYSGGNFYTNYALFYAATISNLTTSAPSSSSGSSGGFSGGGGGGGGGGSW